MHEPTLDQNDVKALQRHVARLDARLRLILGGALVTTTLAILAWAPIAISQTQPADPAIGAASVWEVLNRFTANTPAVADEVNDNFEIVYDRTVQNATDLATLTVATTNGARLDDGTVGANELAAGAVNAQVREYIRNHCHISIGWRDNCSGCTAGPAHMARRRVGNDLTGCTSGSGEHFCLDDGWAAVRTNGDVDGNDVFYVDFGCE
ncbi:hypothetical protein [Haliangium sp.]|uniref:hypothetical protein n=1 Tax=Haliangium sp. TaxID=2663208 RepID=UPI003D139F3A